MNETERQEIRKSKVRVYVTYMATSFLFGGGALFILFLIIWKKHDEAISMFQTILPVSSAIISYWFATRGAEKKSESEKNSKITGNEVRQS